MKENIVKNYKSKSYFLENYTNQIICLAEKKQKKLSDIFFVNK